MKYTLVGLKQNIDVVEGNIIKSSFPSKALFNGDKLIGIIIEKDRGFKVIKDLADNEETIKDLISGKSKNIEPLFFELMGTETIDFYPLGFYEVNHYGLTKIHSLYIDQHGGYWYKINNTLMKTSELLKYEEMINKLESEVMLVI